MKRQVVYILGAGFSRSLGYPLATDLLPGVWKRLSKSDRDRLGKIISFHHPLFDPADANSFPNLEPLLTAMAVNEELFDSSRGGVGKFDLEDLVAGRKLILVTIEKWFHEIYQATRVRPPWLVEFKKRLISENAAIISFNWDLVLDHLLFGKTGRNISDKSYGFTVGANDYPVLLKPHGSLNWFGDPNATRIKEDRRVELFTDKTSGTTYYAFLRARAPTTKHRQVYEPLLIPPTYMKKFDRPIFQKMWNESVDTLSTARTIYFLGYSMPDEDRHTQFILHCGFHNQVDGKLKADGTRTKPTGKAHVVIVNPSLKAAKRTRDTVGPAVKCKHIKKRVEEWIAA